MPDPLEQPLETERLSLAPMRPSDAEDLFEILRDPAIGVWMDEAPPEDAAEVRARIESWMRGPGGGNEERWLNWLARTPDGSPVAQLSATLQGASAWLAWIVSVQRQRSGYATEAARAIKDRLASSGVGTFLASIPAGHEASEGVAGKLGLVVTDEVAHGERVWRSPS
jgi:RimJ/RimL family protein N-acetyltransferase